MNNKWKSPLLLLVLSLFLFESVSGFILFFFGEFIPGKKSLGVGHWIAGFCTLLPYAVYQWRHYFSVRVYSSQFHYKLGTLSFIAAIVVIVSGIPLLLDLNPKGTLFVIIDLTHVVSSFAFLILLSGHLVLVAKITFGREKQKVPAMASTFAVIGKRVVFVPLLVSIVILLLLSLLA